MTAARLENTYPHIHQVVVDMAANRSDRTPVALQSVECCMESRLMTRGDMVSLDDWLSMLAPEELQCITAGDPDDALDLLLESPETLAGDHVGELLADIFHAI